MSITASTKTVLSDNVAEISHSPSSSLKLGCPLWLSALSIACFPPRCASSDQHIDWSLPQYAFLRLNKTEAVSDIFGNVLSEHFSIHVVQGLVYVPAVLDPVFLACVSRRNTDECFHSQSHQSENTCSR